MRALLLAALAACASSAPAQEVLSVAAPRLTRAPRPQGSTIIVRLVDGARRPLPAGVQVLMHVRDGNQKEIVSGYYAGSTIEFDGLPFHDNFGDDYAVIAWAKGYEQAGFFPVRIKKDEPVAVDLMLVPKNARFDFSRAGWGALKTSRPELWQILKAGAADEAAAQARYEKLMSERPASLACLLNIAEAMRRIKLPDGSDPMHYFGELIWDDTMAQDRFFGHADVELLDQVKAEPQIFTTAPYILHPGAFTSYKQIQFGEANVQLTFHHDQTRVVPDDWHQHGHAQKHIVVEPDIDYYKDTLAHMFLEVIPSAITGGLSDPKVVYQLRWIAGRQAGDPDFDPLYDLAP